VRGSLGQGTGPPADVARAANVANLYGSRAQEGQFKSVSGKVEGTGMEVDTLNGGDRRETTSASERWA